MPSVTTVPTENTEETSQSMCAVVKGYPIVIRNSDNPSEKWGVPYDAPLFHWYTKKDRQKQLVAYMSETFGITKEETLAAIKAGDAAQKSFDTELKKAGAKVLEDVQKAGKFAVVLASRPYQNDALVNHDLPLMFTKAGIPVLTADSLSEVNRTDLHRSRIDVVNNYHARMLSSAILAAQSENLEYVQVVSFGCGHDAYLSDEIVRMMKEISGKTPLILKVDESDIQGPLGIRVRSFLETVEMGREKKLVHEVKPLAEPYPVKFTKESRKERVVLVPNTSHAFCRVMSAALSTQGIKAIPLDIGREEAIRLGKQYVHNDICFPAQIVIGEALAALRSGKYDGQKVAIGMGKYVGDCRLTHYGALLRKALDDAGYADVPILTNDDADSHDMHPGFKMNILSAARIAFALPMIDVLEELLRKIRPYELTKGSVDAVHEKWKLKCQEFVSGKHMSFFKFQRMCRQMIEEFDAIPVSEDPKPRVGIVGEILVKFLPAANNHLAELLEAEGAEPVCPDLLDFMLYCFYNQIYKADQLGTSKKAAKISKFGISAVNFVRSSAAKAFQKSKHFDPPANIYDLVDYAKEIVSIGNQTGEGWFLTGEMMELIHSGATNIVCTQPFGCLPNHVVGKGVIKELRRRYPQANIVAIDYDPGASEVNQLNRIKLMLSTANKNLKKQQSDQKEASV